MNPRRPDPAGRLLKRQRGRLHVVRGVPPWGRRLCPVAVRRPVSIHPSSRKVRVDVLARSGHETVDGRTRYRLLETIRLYAQDKLASAGDAERIRSANRDWFLQRVAAPRCGIPACWARGQRKRRRTGIEPARGLITPSPVLKTGGTTRCPDASSRPAVPSRWQGTSGSRSVPVAHQVVGTPHPLPSAPGARAFTVGGRTRFAHDAPTAVAREPDGFRHGITSRSVRSGPVRTARYEARPGSRWNLRIDLWTVANGGRAIT